jgi:hypothetical protein
MVTRGYRQAQGLENSHPGHFTPSLYKRWSSAFFGRINDARQFCINSLKLVCTCNPLPRGSTLEGDMNAIPEVSTQVVPEKKINYVVNVIAMMCGLGIVVAACVATSGLDMSVGFF